MASFPSGEHRGDGSPGPRCFLSTLEVAGGQGRSANEVLCSAVTLIVCMALGALVLGRAVVDLWL